MILRRFAMFFMTLLVGMNSVHFCVGISEVMASGNVSLYSVVNSSLETSANPQISSEQKESAPVRYHDLCCQDCCHCAAVFPNVMTNNPIVEISNVEFISERYSDVNLDGPAEPPKFS